MGGQRNTKYKKKEVQEMPDPGIPVYRVRAVDKSGRTRTLHRNMLLPCTGLDEGEEIQKAEVQKVGYMEKKVFTD